MKTCFLRLVKFFSGIISVALLVSPAAAANIASDNAASVAYSSGWTNGANGGSGFNAWILTNYNAAGFFVQSSTNNGAGDPGGDGDIDTAGRAWGLFASLTPSVGTALATRPFSSELEPGQQFVVDFDNGYLQNSASPPGRAGFSLQNSYGREKFWFQFTGGDTTCKIVDGSGLRDTGIPFTSQGLHVVFTMGGIGPTSTYTVQISPSGDDGPTNLPVTISGNLFSSAFDPVQTIDRVQLFNYAAGNDSTADVFFNSMSIPPPNSGAFKILACDSAADAAYSGGFTNGSNGGSGWGGAWSFSTGAGGGDGKFIGTSQANGAADGNIDTAGRAWGLWANDGGSINAIRPFGFTLHAGQTFAVDLDTGYIDAGGQVGFMLAGFGDPRGSSQFTFEFSGGGTNYVINTGKYYWTMSTNTGVPFTSKGVHVAVTLGTNGAFTCAITPAGGTPTLISGVDPAGGGGLDHVELFNSNAGTGASHDAFFNNLAVTENIAALASDSAADANYGNGWNHRNGGSGWGGAWKVSVSGPGNPAGGAFLGHAPQIDGGAGSFGLFAGSNSLGVIASRAFPQPLGLGQSFVLDMQNGFVASNSLVAFELTGGLVQWQFGFPGGGTNYQIGMFTYTGPNYVDTGVPFTTNGLRVIVTPGVDTNGYLTYTAAITPKGGATRTITGQLRGGFGGAVTIPVLNQVQLYTDNPPGSAYDVFFNNLAIIPAPQLGGVSLAGGTNAVISFTPSGVLRHEVLASDDFFSTNWSVLATNLTGSGNSPVQVQDAGSHPQRFYRLRAASF